MKFRKGFVTNSSSSSFIVAFNSKDEAIEYFEEKREINEIFNWVLRDINNEPQITFEEAVKFAEEQFQHDAYYRLAFCRYMGYRNFIEYLEAKQKRKIPYCELSTEPEFAQKRAELVSEKLEIFKEKIQGVGYIAILSYEDDTKDGAELEHEIMPQLDCTIERFSHH